MTIHFPTLNKTNIKLVAFSVLFVVLIVAVSVLSVDKYRQHRADVRHQQAIAYQKRVESNRLVAEKEVKRQATLSKLVSICMESQQSFDKLPLKDRVGHVRPDCTIAE